MDPKHSEVIKEFYFEQIGLFESIVELGKEVGFEVLRDEFYVSVLIEEDLLAAVKSMNEGRDAENSVFYSMIEDGKRRVELLEGQRDLIGVDREYLDEVWFRDFYGGERILVLEKR